MGQINSSEKKGFISPYKNLGEELKNSTKPKNFGTFTVPQPKKIERNGGWSVSPQLVDTRVGADIRKIQGESANIDAFGVENVRKLRQMGFNPDQINTYIKALSFNADTISQTTQNEYQETISKNPDITTTENGYTANLTKEEDPVITNTIEKAKEKDLDTKSFSQWSVKHHMKIIQRSNKTTSTEIKPATPEEIAEDKVTKILRSIVGAKRLNMKKSDVKQAFTTDITTETPSLPIEETATLQDNASAAVIETPAPATEEISVTEDEVSATNTSTIETIVGRSLSPENEVKVARPQVKDIKPSNFMKRLGMSSEESEEVVSVDSNQTTETVATEVQDTVLETAEEKSDEPILRSLDVDKSHPTPLEQAQEKKRTAVAILMAALEKNRVELWSNLKSEAWVGLSQPTINKSTIPVSQTIPQTLETKPTKSWRDSSVLSNEASLVLQDLVTS